MMIARSLIWLGILATTVASLQAAWTPPANPSPDIIFEEMRVDLAAKRYEDALAKHVWYHDNALKYQPAHAGVRLSYALNNWLELGKAYPPAMEKLKSIQNQLEEELVNGKGNVSKFHDFSAINQRFGEAKRTAKAFLGLHAKSSPLAKSVFHMALPALLESMEYKLCLNYIQPEQFYQKAVKDLQFHRKYEAENPSPVPRPSFGRMNFSNDCAILVALLVKSNRPEEAAKIAADAGKELDDQKFKIMLEKALKGELPPPWP